MGNSEIQVQQKQAKNSPNSHWDKTIDQYRNSAHRFCVWLVDKHSEAETINYIHRKKHGDKLPLLGKATGVRLEEAPNLTKSCFYFKGAVSFAIMIENSKTQKVLENVTAWFLKSTKSKFSQ